MIHCLFFSILVFKTIVFVNGMQCSNIDTAIYGFSYPCSSFSIASDPKYKNLIPTGEIVIFAVQALDINCNAWGCMNAGLVCSYACECCRKYSGANPALHPYILAPKNETNLYQQYFNCTNPPWVPVTTGIYFIYCNFSGYGMANPEKLLQVNLTWNALNIWNLPPYTYDVYITAGNISLQDTIWQWERGNKFPLNEYGVFTMQLYDAYGNKVSAATGACDLNLINMNVTVKKFGTSSNDSSGQLQAVKTNVKVTCQLQYGLCMITIYCTSTGKYQLAIRDDHWRSLLNTPTTFFVVPDESWTGSKYEPPPSPQLYFLSDNYNEEMVNGVPQTHVTIYPLIFSIALSTFIVVGGIG